MDSEKKLQAQIALIEHVCRKAGVTYDELGVLLLASPETIRKWRKGYQPVGERTLEVIEALPRIPNLQEKLREIRRQAPKRPSGKTDTMKERPEPSATRVERGTLSEQFEYVLEHATYGEQTLLRALVEAAYKMISARTKAAGRGGKKGVKYTPGEE